MRVNCCGEDLNDFFRRAPKNLCRRAVLLKLESSSQSKSVAVIETTRYAQNLVIGDLFSKFNHTDNSTDVKASPTYLVHPGAIADRPKVKNAVT